MCVVAYYRPSTLALIATRLHSRKRARCRLRAHPVPRRTHTACPNGVDGCARGGAAQAGEAAWCVPHCVSWAVQFATAAARGSHSHPPGVPENKRCANCDKEEKCVVARVHQSRARRCPWRGRRRAHARPPPRAGCLATRTSACHTARSCAACARPRTKPFRTASRCGGRWRTPVHHRDHHQRGGFPRAPTHATRPHPLRAGDQPEQLHGRGGGVPAPAQRRLQ